MNSINEHGSAGGGVQALGRGSKRPRPKCSGPSANRSSSRAISILDGCRRTPNLTVDDGDAERGLKRDDRSADGS